MDALKKIEEWYTMQCNGDWEHSHGVKIETLDNPGWSLTVDLMETEKSEAQFGEVSIERSESDWFRCWKLGGSFYGVGGSRNLYEILTTFLKFVNTKERT